MKQKYINAHMRVAHEYAKLSSAKRLQVGCIVVKDNRIISIGYNGMPTGWDNECEDVIGQDDVGALITKSKPEVLHAETNAIAKLAGSNESGKDATLFVTHQPCLDCAKIIYQTGIKEVYYNHTYRSIEGIKFLEKCNIKVKKVDD
jgi:dCMP deaminase